jgi:hypothetical protein
MGSPVRISLATINIESTKPFTFSTHPTLLNLLKRKLISQLRIRKITSAQKHISYAMELISCKNHRSSRFCLRYFLIDLKYVGVRPVILLNWFDK